MPTLEVDPTLLTDEPTDDAMVDGQDGDTVVRRRPGRPKGSRFGDWTWLPFGTKKKKPRDITPAWALDPSLLPKKPPGVR